MNDLAKKIEVLLFISGEGMTLRSLASRLKKSEAEIKSAIAVLKEHLNVSHDLTVLEYENKISIVSSKNVSWLVEEFAKEEFSGELTRAALETLAIIAYKGPIRRADIDYIRGVNSSFMIRNLLMRGLVERARDPKDNRTFAYRASSDLLKLLGITSITDLPEFGSFVQKLEEFINKADTAVVNEQTQ